MEIDKSRLNTLLPTPNCEIMKATTKRFKATTNIFITAMILIYTHCILTVLKSSTHSWDSRYVAYGRRLKNMKISQVHWKWLSTKSKTKRSCPILVLQWPVSSLLGLSVRLTLLGIFYSAIWPVSGNRLKLPQLLFRPRLLVYFENYFFLWLLRFVGQHFFFIILGTSVWI